MPSCLHPLTILRLLLCLALGIAVCHAQNSIQTSSQTSAVPALSTPLRLPTGLAYDTAGALLFTERAGHIVRRLDASGTLTTIAGTGIQGFSGDGAPAAQATFDSPEAVVSDALGNLTIADTGNHRIRRVAAATGIVTTIAGTGKEGSSGDNGAASAATLDRPSALAIDPAGDLFIADSRGQRIRRVDAATGIITTVAGNGTEGFSGDGGLATAAALDQPSALALDPSGNLLIADTRNARIRLVSAASGQIQTLAGGPASPLRAPVALAVDPVGNILIADSALHRILRLDATTHALTPIAGSGTEAFLGDGAPAIAATLDSPGGLAIAADGSLVIADTGNSRIRIVTAPASGPALIQTIAGLSSIPPPILTLSGATVAIYGSGALAVAIAGGSVPQGSVTLLDLSSANPSSAVATAPLSGGFASLPTAALAAGLHHLVATYGGDATHLPATSTAWTLTVTPLPITASPAPASMLFGQPVPALTGTLSGVLTRDTAAIQAVFTVAAASTSSPAAYPIAATLTGPAAPNYTVAVAPVAFTIAKAPAVTTVTNLSGTLAVQVASTTSGTPTGAISLRENGATLAAGALTSTAAWSFNTATLSAGQHQLTAVYSGDPDFLPGQSAPFAVTINGASPPTPQPDFSLSPTVTGAVSALGGSPAAIPFAITTTHGSLADPIALSVSGLPSLATATFDPPSIPPGGAVNAFTLTVTPPASAAYRKPLSPLTPLLCLTLLPMALLHRRSPAWLRLTGCVLLAILLPLTGCGNRVNTGATAASPAPTLYTLTVTGAATSADGALLTHTATVQLSVTP